MHTYTKRIEKIPPYPFAELDRKINEARAAGIDVISLGVGDPDLPTPRPIIESLCKAANDPVNHRYPSYEGLPQFRAAAAAWMERRFGVKLDPANEIVSLIGSKEGIAHIYLAFVQLGDISLVPSPGYPVYNVGTILADGTSTVMPLTARHGFLPDLDAIPPEVLNKARIMFLNYPNNPTAAVADIDFYRKAVQLARKHNIVLCHDAAYSEITYDGFRSPSIFEVEGAGEVAIEFHSLSKTFNMTGWRLGFAAGKAEIIKGLRHVKSNVDSGVFQAVQVAGITALEMPQADLQPLRDTMRDRRDIAVEALNAIGWIVPKPKGTFYIWVPVPKEFKAADPKLSRSLEFCNRVIQETGVALTPGTGFGAEGEGYFRISYTLPTDRLREAMDRLMKFKL